MGQWIGASSPLVHTEVLSGTASGSVYASLPTDGTPWNAANVVTITNDKNVTHDSMAFSHDSTQLFSNNYATSRNTVYTWNVGNLAVDGVGLTQAATFASTDVARIRSLSSYYINGKDLVYYGDGVGGAKCLLKRVNQQQRTDTQTGRAGPEVAGQTPDQHRRHRIFRQAAGEIVRELVMTERSGGQRVIAQHPARFLLGHVDLRQMMTQALAGVTPQILVQPVMPRGKTATVMAARIKGDDLHSRPASR